MNKKVRKKKDVNLSVYEDTLESIEEQAVDQGRSRRSQMSYILDEAAKLYRESKKRSNG